MSELKDLDEIEVGAILEEDVVNSQGLTLLKRGTVLEDKHKKILMRWGIQRVTVTIPGNEVEDGRSPEEIISDRKNEIINDLDQKFCNHSEDTLMMELKQLVKDFRIRRVISQYEKD